MKKYIVGGTGKNKIYEVSYLSSSGELEGTCYTKIIAKDIIEAAEILINLEKVNATDIKYITEVEGERIIG